IERRPLAELAPTITRIPPGYSFARMVLPESRLRESLTSARSGAQSSISGAMRGFEVRLAISVVGCTAMIGPGARWMIKPSQLLPDSVAPICAPFMKTVISLRDDGESESMISFRYGVRDVRHGPGSGDDLVVRMRYASAHSLTLRLGSGFAPAAAAVA